MGSLTGHSHDGIVGKSQKSNSASSCRPRVTLRTKSIWIWKLAKPMLPEESRAKTTSSGVSQAEKGKIASKELQQRKERRITEHSEKRQNWKSILQHINTG